ncbi:neurogenic locus notch homolog protein 1-like [Rhopilema esculentum]|uniref:neurogenic locus notch homolog protein 1-like n=1 Tax=Rhopilema esculentum TaxID=499914 RepID=UPI0031DBE85E
MLKQWSLHTSQEMANRGVICMIFLTIPIAFGLHKFLRMSCRNEALFKGKYRDLTVTSSSSHIISLTTELQVRHCARGCTKNTLCKSFAFNKLLSEGNCKLLNNEKSDLNTNDIISSSGWILYEPVEQTSSRCQGRCTVGYACKETCGNTDGYTCEDINECLTSPCANGGTCSNTAGSYSCSCSSGWSGTHCRKKVLGTITSINYPSNYLDNYEEAWNLKAGSTCKIEITFDSFLTESTHDRVSLWDGSPSSSSLIITLSGNHTGATYCSTGFSMYVNFTTDHSKVYTGFKGTYKCVP